MSSCLFLLMAGAAVLVVEDHLHSQARYQEALGARSHAAIVQGAATLFWREREAINEYLLHPSPAVLSEVQQHRRGFERTLAPFARDPTLIETALESSAVAANGALLAAFDRDRRTGGPVTRAETRELDALGVDVVAPLGTALRLNLAGVRSSEGQAVAAARAARLGMIGGGVLLAALLGIFVTHLVRLVRRLHRQALESEYAALHDPLTGLPNRLLFRDRLEHQILCCSRDPSPFSLLMFDLDRFKEINDTLGHSMGDLLLREIGPRVRGSIRPGDTLARLGGDEFAVLLPGAGAKTAAVVADRILATLRRPFDLPAMSPRMSASIGIVTYPAHGIDAEALIQHADVALYQAKEHRNTSATYDAGHDPYNPDRLALASDLDRAIDGDEFVLHYQPKFSAHTLELVSVEALVRWQHPQHGLRAPADFIGLAEDTGLIKQLTHLVLRKAVHQIRQWRDDGILRVVSVNLSAANLLDADLVRDVTSILAGEDVDASQLELEITETTIMTDPERALTVLQELAALGIRLSIDDFGTGYSSLAYLRRLPVHEVKIDRSFVQHLAQEAADAKIVSSTIELAHSLGFSVVAEGVEDQQALELLADYGCDRVQGFHLCRPTPAGLLTEALRRVQLERSSSTNGSPQGAPTAPGEHALPARRG